MDDENHQHIFNVQIPPPRVITPPLPPQTPEHQMFSSNSFTRSENDKETDSDETDSDGTSTDKRDPKNLTFDEYVDSDAGHVGGNNDEETPDYNYGEVNVEEAKRNEQESKLITEEINKMKSEYSERYHKIRPENKWKLPSGKFAEDILYEYTLNLEYERYLS
jgi:hypothetical protein